MNVASVTSHVHPPHPHAYPIPWRTRVLLIALEASVAVAALMGAIGLIADSEGFGAKQSWLDGTPFSDYTIPAIILFAVIGCGMLVAAMTAAVSHRYATLAAFCMGATLLVFLAVEAAVIGYQGGTQLVLLAIVGIPALVLVALGSPAVRDPARRR